MKAGLLNLLPGIVALSLVACGGESPVSDQANEMEEPADVDVLPPDESSSTPSNELANGVINSAAADQAGGPIPASMHGRWALTPEDCRRPVGGAEGAVLVSGREIRFYESVARPVAVLERSANSVSGDFLFTGEGNRWTRHQVLQLQGDTLVRTQSEPMESFAYARCSS